MWNYSSLLYANLFYYPKMYSLKVTFFFSSSKFQVWVWSQFFLSNTRRSHPSVAGSTAVFKRKLSIHILHHTSPSPQEHSSQTWTCGGTSAAVHRGGDVCHLQPGQHCFFETWQPGGFSCLSEHARNSWKLSTVGQGRVKRPKSIGKCTKFYLP